MLISKTDYKYKNSELILSELLILIARNGFCVFQLGGLSTKLGK